MAEEGGQAGSKERNEKRPSTKRCATSFPFDWGTFVWENTDHFAGAPDEPPQKVADLYPEVRRLRDLFPELQGWGDLALFVAWNEYEQAVWLNATQTVPENDADRPLAFLGFLYVRQTKPQHEWSSACAHFEFALQAYDEMRQLYRP